MQNTVELLSTDIIYAVKISKQTEHSLLVLSQRINEIASTLRAQNKKVLILVNALKEEGMDDPAAVMALKIGAELDYDKSATYVSSMPLYGRRNLMIGESQLMQKVATFTNKAEALEWLTA